MMDLETKVQYLPGVGPKIGAKLEKLGIEKINDLIFYYPRNYLDFSQITAIKNVISTPREARVEKSFDRRSLDYARDDSSTARGTNEKVTIRGKILEIANKKTSRRRFTVTEAVVEDGTGSIKVVWFNQPFLLKMLPAGREVILNGKIEYNFYSKEVVMESPERALRPSIVPVYGETAGLTSNYIRKLVTSVMKFVLEDVEEYLPKELLINSKFDLRQAQIALSSSRMGEIRNPKQILNSNDQNLKTVIPTGAEESFTHKSSEDLSTAFHSARDDNIDGLLPIQEAILNIHSPKNAEMLLQARRRIAFDELFLIALRANLSKEEIKKESAPAILINDKKVAYATFLSYLPFELTDDQKKAAEQILEDMAGKSQISNLKSQSFDSHSVAGLNSNVVPMNRLLNGDVGSGKTVVAAIAAYAAVKAGFRVAIMAPTEILAFQHYETFCRLFQDDGISIGLFTRERQEASQITNSKIQISNKNSNAKIQKLKKQDTSYQILTTDVVIGTQALIQVGVELENLGLVIVDEQHRFGVKQRGALLTQIRNPNIEIRNHRLWRDPVRMRDKSQNSKSQNSKQINELTNQPINLQKMRPHFLSMTATPIPRTMHLALFGDLDISVIKEKPANRKEIKTRFVEPKNREKAYQFIRAHIKAGRQAFVICPLIEDKNHESGIMNHGDGENSVLGLFEDERKTVKAEYEKLQKIYPEFKIGMLHGKMKAKEKDEVMAEFSNNRLNILVSTSVVEVGVDVPNATVMMIEDAERFGLAQIHQFRGRVGRAEHQSFCFLFSPTMSQKALERLKALENTSDGFKLAEIDLETRGPGAVFGTEQSGMLDLKMANFSDLELIEQASSAAKSIVEKDPELKNHKLLKNKVSEYLNTKHLE